MESNKYYIVSFGNSDKYRMAFNGSAEELKKSPEFVKIEKGIKECLKSDFPESEFAALISPSVASAGDDALSYPPLDDKAIEDIRKVIKREGEVALANRKLDKNAPYADIR